MLSYNYGARDRERILGGIRFGLAIVLGVMGAGTLLVWLLAAPLLEVCFKAGPEALEMGVGALRMVACSFLPAGVSIVFTSAFQSLGYSGRSLAVALLRQLVLLLPAAALFLLAAPGLVWLSFLIAEGVTMVVTLLCYRTVRRRTIDTLCPAAGQG